MRRLEGVERLQRNDPGRMEETFLHGIFSEYGLYAGTFFVCFISGLVPVVNAEIYLLFASSQISRALFVPVLLVGVAGHMVAKFLLYLSGKGVMTLSPKRYRRKVEDAEKKFAQWKGKVDLVVFASALIGLPPFYAVTVAAGGLRVSPVRFFLFGTVGRLLRFGIVMLFPQVAKAWFL